MSKLLTRIRNSIPPKEFGLPEERKYPMEDKAHARNAKARASEEYNAGHLTKAQEERIDHKADRKLHGEKAHEEYERMTKND